MARIVIAAGGTAGHVVPALAVADELRARGAEVSFIGTPARAEAKLVPAAGYELFHLSVAGLDRRHPLRAARAAGKAGAAAVASLRLLRRLRPDAVLGAGGYVAGPVGLAAATLRIPLVLLENDSRLGVANRLLAPLARRVCLAFAIEGRAGGRYLVTGRPVSKDIITADREVGRARLGIGEDDPCLLVFGGSLGARSINLCALEAFAERPPDGGSKSPVVLHVAGERDYPELAARLEHLRPGAHYRLCERFESFAEPLAACDVVIARAGGSVFELAAAGKPAILVPYPHATADHQTTNAHWMANAGAAVVIADRDLEPALLRRTVAELLEDRARLEAMSAAARSMARPDAAERVAVEVLEAAESPAPAEEPWQGRRLHFVGIGGAGMSGLALVARRLGAEVSGCDRSDSAYTRMLRRSGIDPVIGHSPDHVAPGIELVVSTAVPEDTPEVKAARDQDVALVRRGSLLAEVASLRRLVAVAGTHGKTTSAAMTAHCLTSVGLEPGFLIGGELRAGAGEVAVNAAWGKGGWLIAEADESDRSFLELSPEIAIVTNVELDHHTTYGSLLELEEAFASFLSRLPERGAAAVWDRPGLRRLVPEGRRVVTFGIEEDAGSTSQGPELAARDLTQGGTATRFLLMHDGVVVCVVELPVPGRHNVLNALAALSACHLVGSDLERAARALASFRAAARRFELKGEAAGARVFDDYAHHPTEVAATLEAARALSPRRLIAVFQPHLYSRTLRLHRQLGRELARADVVVVLDVYPSRERPEGELAGVSGKLVADSCADHASGRPVWWLPTLEEAEDMLVKQISDGDLVLTLGAGNVDCLAERLVERLGGSPPPDGEMGDRSIVPPALAATG